MKTMEPKVKFPSGIDGTQGVGDLLDDPIYSDVRFVQE